MRQNAKKALPSGVSVSCTISLTVCGL